MMKSKAKSFAKSGSLDVLMNMLLVDWFFNYLFNAKRGISRWVKISRSGIEGSLGFFPVINLIDLYFIIRTSLFLSLSGTLTIWPKLGTTLILIVLNIVHIIPVFCVSILEWHCLNINIIYWRSINNILDFNHEA